MTSKLVLVILFAAALTSIAAAAPIDYTVSFTGTGGVGPGAFTFDSMGVTGVVLDPPVAFPSFVVLVGGMPFTPMSAADDALIIGPTGLVDALNVDVNPGMGAQFVQLSEDLTYKYFDANGAVIGAGTYSIAPVPEPAAFALAALGLAGVYLKRIRARR